MAGNRTSRVVMVGNLASPFQTPSRRARWDSVKGKCRQNDELGRLNHFLTIGKIDVLHASGVRLVRAQLDTHNMRSGPQLEIRLLQDRRQESGLWAGFRKMFAAKALAIATD